MTLSAKYMNTLAVYEYMDTNSLDDIIEGQNIRTWTGRTTEILPHLGISPPQYSPIIGKLKAMGCIAQITRGGGGTPSKWALLYKPTPDLYASSGTTASSADQHSSEAGAAQFQRDVSAIVNTLSSKVDVLLSAMENFDLRLDDLNNRLSSIENATDENLYGFAGEPDEDNPIDLTRPESTNESVDHDHLQSLLGE